MTTRLITGASRGLGKHAASCLVAAGHTVFLGARDADRGRVVAEETGSRMVVLDVTSDESVAAAARFIADEVGPLDALINNTGIVGGPPGSAWWRDGCQRPAGLRDQRPRGGSDVAFVPSIARG